MTAEIRLGLPNADRLKSYRIWDSYFTPSHSHPGKNGRSLIREIERAWRPVELAHIEKLCFFAHVGIGTTSDPAIERELQQRPDLVTLPIQRWPNRLLGMMQINSNNVRASLDAIQKWIIDGPMLGAYFPGGGPGACACNDKRLAPLYERLNDAKAVIMQHTWFKTGGKGSKGESTPAELAELARRYPDQEFICAHAGGEWERGIRAVQNSKNVLLETSGFDATAGFIEMAVRSVGAERIIFGSHLPSRSLGTELSKVIAAQISENEKHQILGENLRRRLGKV